MRNPLFKVVLLLLATRAGCLLAQDQPRLHPVMLSGKWGAVDDAGEWKIPPQFGSEPHFVEGLARECIGECTSYAKEGKSHYGFIDRQGGWAIRPIFSAAGDFHQGRAAVSLHRDGDTRIGSDRGRDVCGFVDVHGKFVIPPVYDAVGDFSEGLAAVKRAGAYSFIDLDGKLAIPAKFEGAGGFSGGWASAQLDYSSGWGFIDRSGKWIVEPKYQEPRTYDAGLALVSLNHEPAVDEKTAEKPPFWINGQGEVLQGFDDIVDGFAEDLAMVGRGEKYGFVDRSGKLVIPPVFEGAGDFSEGVAAAEDRGKWGFIDRSGKWVIPAQFGSVGSFKGGWAPIRYGEDPRPEDQRRSSDERPYSFIDKTGTIVWPKVRGR